MLLAPDIVCVFLNILPLTKEQSQGPATELILAVGLPHRPTARINCIPHSLPKLGSVYSFLPQTFIKTSQPPTFLSIESHMFFYAQLILFCPFPDFCKICWSPLPLNSNKIQTTLLHKFQCSHIFSSIQLYCEILLYSFQKFGELEIMPQPASLSWQNPIHVEYLILNSMCD